ncbi:phosphotransferase [Streptomyces sp. NBC_00091]|uniref:phosphotransferase n=1 Tax=Streptomyces sp. NBC_00091 TaxID=2975648 RepID=UPI002256E34B|nr:phosphotransferase [Streptomyces sp. NBC_00091]MCX5375258.1 phosphotransferase [Streptomyces sp. NBC_00091]
MDVSQHVEWARSMFPFPDGATYPGIESCTTGALRAARHLAVAYNLHRKGRPVDDVRYYLGAGLKGMGVELENQGGAKQAVLALQVGHLVLLGDPDADSSRGAEISRNREICAQRLQDLGALQLHDLPPRPDEPIWDLAEILTSDPADIPAPRTTPLARPRARFDEIEESDEGPGEPEDDEDSEGVGGHERFTPRLLRSEAATAAELVDELAAHWSPDRAPADERIEEMLAYFREVSRHHGAFDRELGRRLEEDAKAVLAYFPQGIPSDLRDLQNLARSMRNFATQTKALDERRLRWVISATANHWMWKVDNGLPTNRPHVLHDLMGYLTAFLSSNLRFMDPARDLILDCAEIQLRVAHQVPPVFFERYPTLRFNVLASVGTYLMLSGPNPALPQESNRDPRVYTAGKTDRSTWPELLLRHWQKEGSRNGACFALACVSGWDETCAHWVIDVVFDHSANSEGQAERGEWKEGVSTLLETAGKVRVASNPWTYDSAATPRGTSLVTAAGGAVRIPTPVLRAVVAQGLSHGEVVTVHGRLFKDRRMPTYLLTTRYGPRSVLKIDQRDKVLREEANFRTFAKRLHPNNRPSECDAKAMEMYLGDNGDPLRAVETAYAFEEGETPRTLTSWIRTASPDMAVKTIEKLLLTNMRPWLAHSRRDRIDLRAEYPVFRPAPAPRKQSPASWARTELRALTADAVKADLGMELTPEVQDTSAWGESAPGLRKAMAQLSGVATVNPLWFAAELSETGQGMFEEIINSFDIGLLDFDTTLVLAHGDLHLDNVLCTLSNEQPKPVLIDFESAHDGHVCKDFARLEASLLCQVFTWDQEAAGRVASWIASVLAGEKGELLPRPAGTSEKLTAEEQLMLQVTRRIREITIGCGQGHWPVTVDEYHLALAGALLPMVRYSTLTLEQRKFALTLSTVITSALWHKWNAAVRLQKGS